MFEMYGEAPKVAALYVNGKSRRGAATFEIANKKLRELGVQLIDAQLLTSKEKFQSSVKTQVESGTPLIILGGGDGTLGSSAHFFTGSQTVMGVLPLGTGNAFARDLGVQMDVDRACEVIAEGKVAKVDIGYVGDRNFLNVATIGLTTVIAEGLHSEAKRVLGRAVYFFSVARALTMVQPFLVKLDLPEGSSSFECLQLVIGNGRLHAGPFPIAPDATITGPFLSVYALATRNKSAFLKMAIHMANGTHVKLDEVRYFRTRSGHLNSVPSQDMILDGEFAGRTPQKFGMAERVLGVVVPQEFHG